MRKNLSIVVFLLISFVFASSLLAEMPPAPPSDDTIIDDGDDFVEATLLRASNDYKVYEIKDGKRHWIPTAEIFNDYSFDWNNIQIVPEAALMNYPRAKLIKTATDEKVYYLTESGMVRHIPSVEVFESYGNNWEDIFEVSVKEIDVYEKSALIRAEGDYKVYLLENTVKRWIKTAEEFNRRGYNWNKIAPVNQIEINFYQTGQIIE